MLESLLATGFKEAPMGQQIFTTTGTVNWVVPEGVFSLSAVCVGAGGGGSGNPGANGAVRIIWGEGRSYPSTGTIDV